MAHVREELLYNGTGAGHQVRQSGAFDLQEQTIIIASANLSGAVTIQVLQPVLGMWFDVMVAGKPLQLTPQNTFQLMTIQGAYRIKPGEATGQAVIWFREVSHVPEWNWCAEGGQEAAEEMPEAPVSTIGSASATDVSGLPSGTSISIQKPGCCEIKVITTAGEFLVAASVTGYAIGDLVAPTTVLGVEVVSGACDLSDVIVTVSQ